MAKTIGTGPSMDEPAAVSAKRKAVFGQGARASSGRPSLHEQLKAWQQKQKENGSLPELQAGMKPGHSGTPIRPPYQPSRLAAKFGPVEMKDGDGDSMSTASRIDSGISQGIPPSRQSRFRLRAFHEVFPDQQNDREQEKEVRSTDDSKTKALAEALDDAEDSDSSEDELPPPPALTLKMPLGSRRT